MELLRVNQAARELGCSETFLRRAEQHGKIPKARRDLNGWRVYALEDMAKLHELIGGVKNTIEERSEPVLKRPNEAVNTNDKSC